MYSVECVKLQGEEGVVGIAREGNTYQLVNLTLAEKRKPRVKLINEVWDVVLETYKHRCAVCGRQEPDVRLEQDHKVPRTRGGGDELENWQPLCEECNNFKMPIQVLALKERYMNKPEELELHLRPRTTETVSIKIPTDTLRSLEKIAATQDMSLEALLKLYIGQGLRQDLAKL